MIKQCSLKHRAFIMQSDNKWSPLIQSLALMNKIMNCPLSYDWLDCDNSKTPLQVDPQMGGLNNAVMYC